MNLYEIDHRLLDCIVDTETGEVLDEEALNRIEVENKAENIACWVKNNRDYIKACKAEKERLSEEIDRTEKRNERLTEYLSYLLNGAKLKTARCSVSYRHSKKVEVLNEEVIPDEYFKVKVERTPSKTAIADAFKAGNPVAGCELVEHVNPIIK